MRAIVKAEAGALQKHDPGEIALKIHGLEAMEKVAKRAKDLTGLEAAVRAKSEAQRDFAAGYQGAYPDGRYARAGAPAKEDYCSRFGFSLRTVQRWCEKLMDDESFERELAERLARVRLIIEMEQAANYSSESVEWYTPRKYIEAAQIVLGEIDLDPASSPEANAVVSAKTYFTKEQNGLDLDWFGTVFLNPPYGKHESGSLAGAFCNKAIAEHVKGNTLGTIVLVNSVHSQKWQKPLFDYPVCLVDHRIEFVSGDGQPNENPTFQNMFVYMGPKLELFRDFFSKFGYVMARLT